MAYTVHARDGGQVIEVRHWGELDVHECRSARAETREHLETSGSHRILVDLREASVAQTMLDLYEFAATFEQIYPAGVKLAVVRSAATSSSRHARFSENVARLHGTFLTMFTDYDAALAWLASE